MKITNGMLCWFLSCVLPAQGKLLGGNLPKQDRLVLGETVGEKAMPIRRQLSRSGICEKSVECEEGCFCAMGECKHYGGVKDSRCEGQLNGFDLDDGGFCHDGRRDRYCRAVDPKMNEPPPTKAKAPRARKEGHEGETEFDEAMEEVEEQNEKTIRRASKMDPYEMFWDDVSMMKGYLMPGRRPDVIKKATELIVVLFVIIWFVIYRMCLYQDDRCPKMHRWAHVNIPARQDDPRIALMKPDVVLVFHKPDFDYPDKDQEINSSILETALVGCRSHPPSALAGNGDFPRSEKLLELSSTAARKNSLLKKLKRSISLKSGVLAGKPSVASTAEAAMAKHKDEKEEDADDKGTDETNKKTKISDFRQALLQDVCEHLPTRGFDVAVFSSVDNDELFVCIGLRNEKTVKQHLQRYGIKLQLQHEVVQTLDIQQPENEVESSPPYIRYDRRLAENVFGQGKRDVDIFKNFGAHSGKPVVISGVDRIRIIHQHLNSHVNLDYAVSHKLLVQWFPAHAEARIGQLQESWARWSLLFDLSLRQPLSLIHDYYGSRVAFIFAWIGLYAKMLICLAPVAIVWMLLNALADYVGKTDLWNRGSVMGFSFAIIIWAKMAFNLWKQEEEFLIGLWDLKNVGKDKSERPDFSGTLERDPTDENKRCLQYPPWKYSLRQFVSWVITLLFCTFVFCCVVMWLDLFAGKMTITASVIQAIMIQIFTQIYNWMAEALTLAENHKFQTNFYTSYLKKMFIFQLVNQYSAFFYIAVKQQFTPKGCPDDDCIGLIKSALPVTLSILAVMQIVQVLLATLIVKFSLWWETRQMKKNGDDDPVYSYVEEQGKYGQFRIREQIEVMSQLSLTLGYILIFGCVAPRIVPLCLLVFMIQLRAGGVLMTTAVNRTVPRMTVGIGPWNEVFYFLMLLGVLFSAYLLVQFAPLFHGTLLLTKMTGFFLYCFLIGLLWVVTDLACPPSDPRSALLDDRRSAVEHVVMQIHEDKNFEGYKANDSSPDPTPRVKSDDPPARRPSVFGDASFIKEVVAGDWDGVPKLIASAAEGEA